MSVDLERLDAALAAIEAEPERWQQRHWFARTSCGTACCLAGMVVSQAGWTPTDWELDYYGDGRTDISWTVEKGEDEGPVGVVARELLGVGYFDAERLFCALNSLEDLKRIRDELAREVSGE